MLTPDGSMLLRGGSFHHTTTSGFHVNVSLTLFESTLALMDRLARLQFLFVELRGSSMAEIAQGWHSAQGYHHTARWLQVAAVALERSDAEVQRMGWTRLRALNMLRCFTKLLLELDAEEGQPPLSIKKEALRGIMRHHSEEDARLMVWALKHCKITGPSATLAGQVAPSRSIEAGGSSASAPTERAQLIAAESNEGVMNASEIKTEN